MSAPVILTFSLSCCAIHTCFHLFLSFSFAFVKFKIIFNVYIRRLAGMISFIFLLRQDVN